jgi:O-antigen/teichoic acid export membrane protein
LSKRIQNIKNRLLRLKDSFIGTGSTGDIFKNMGILASGVGIGKAIGFLTLPVITRIYTPEDFGVLAVFTTAILLIVPLSTLLYSITIPLPKTDGIAVNIVFLCSVLILFITGLLSVLFFFFGDLIFGFFNMEEIAAYWWVLIIGIFTASFYELMTHWATRVMAFAEVAKTKVWQASISAILKIGLGLLGLKPVGLLIGDVGQRGGGVLSLFRKFYEKFKSNLKYVTFNKIKFLLRYYIDLPKYRLPSQFLLKLSSQAPVLYFAFQFGQEETGQLSLSLAMIALPITLLANSTGKAYYAEVSKLGPKMKMKIKRITFDIVKKMIVIGLLPTAIILFFGPFLFKLIFGSEWYLAGLYSRILSIYMLMSFATNPLMHVLNVFNKQIKYLEINMVRTVFLLFIFLTSYLLDINDVNTLLIYSIAIIIHLVYSGYQIYNTIK